MTDAEALAFLKDAGGPPRGGRIVREPEPIFPTDLHALAFLNEEEPKAEVPDGRQAMAQVGGLGPVPAAEVPAKSEGPEINFTGKDAAFRVTGGMVADPTTGQVQPTGAIVFDQSSPERLSQGIEEAWQAGAIDGERYAKLKEMQAPVLKVLEDRRKLEAKAATDPQLAAFLTGAGRGGAAMLGAIGGAKALGAAGAAGGMAVAGPPGAAVGGVALGTVGAIGGGIAAGLGMEQVQRFLGNHFDEYDNALKAAELYPLETTAGQLALALPAAGVSVAQGARALATTASGAGGMPAAVRQGAAALGLGAGTGAAGAAIDATVRGEAVTPETLAVGAAGGAAMGGFFLNPGVARTPEVANILGKIRAGQALTAEESVVAQAVGAARPQGRAQLAAAEQAGGQQVRMDVEVPTASVAGMMPAAGRARVSTEFYVPPKLPEAAVLRLQAGRQAGVRRQGTGDGGQPTAAGTPPLQTEAVIVPRTMSRGQLPEMTGMRTAPVTVLPTGEPIATTEAGAPSPAMMDPLRFVETMAEARGETIFAPEEETGMLAEHFEAVKQAVQRRDPVSAAALDMYEMRVPFYARDEGSGIAQFDEGLFEEHFRLLAESQRADAEQAQDGGVELLKAVMDAGGLPAFTTGQSKAIWSGELKSLSETARAAGERGSSDNRKGVVINKLFRRDAPDLDKMVLALQAKGFRVNSEAELIELLDNRLRSGREVFAYGELSDDPMELAGRRPRGPAPGAPRQLDLLGQDEGGFALVSEVDRTSLTPEEMALRAREAERKAEADAAQGDLFGMEQAGGGGAKVPPGQPVGMAAFQPPDWVLKPGETSEGRRLIKGIENYKPGSGWNFQRLQAMVNRAAAVDMRRSRSQTTAHHPAHYRPADRIAFTQNTQDVINLHEAGHGMFDMIEARAPGTAKAHEAELLALVARPGSMASEPPDAASARQKEYYRLNEGFAEWLRLRITEPDAVEGLKITAAIEGVAAKHYPKMAATVRDAARAFERMKRLPAGRLWAMFAIGADRPVTLGDMGTAVVLGADFLADKLSTGAPLSRLDRRLFRMAVQQRRETGAGRRAMVKAARENRMLTKEILDAHNMVLSVPGEVENAMTGRNPATKGLRVIGKDGQFKRFTTQTWDEMRRKVGASRLQDFDSAAWAHEVLARKARKPDYEWPGMRTGITEAMLRQVVKDARATIPGFDAMVEEQAGWFDALVNLQDYGGMLKPGEATRITDSSDTYWPLPRVMPDGRAPVRGGMVQGQISTGLMRAGRGSGEAFESVDMVAERRTRQALEGYYENRRLNVLVENTRRIAADKRMPVAVRQMAGNVATDLKVKLSGESLRDRDAALQAVVEAVADVIEGAMGVRPSLKDLLPKIKLRWDGSELLEWKEPDDFMIVSRLVDGQRVFTQIKDPATWAMLAQKSSPNDLVRIADWLVGPMSANAKRTITQSLPFGLMNFVRDPFNMMTLARGPWSWVPWGAHVFGLVNRFTKKYPQVFQGGLGLARVEPTDAELVHRMKSTAIYGWLMEGAYRSTVKDPALRKLATMMNPSNLLMPIWKLADLINLVSGGRYVAQTLESLGREGRAVLTKRAGGTDEQAAEAYWGDVGRFNEHSPDASVAAVMRWAMFMNPMVQGVRGEAQRLTDPDPAVSGPAWAKLLLWIPAMFTAVAVLNYLRMTPEERERERQRVIEDRMAMMNLEGMRVPFAYGAGGSMASLAYNAAMDDLLGRKDREGDKQAWALLRRTIDVGSPLQFMGPQFSAMIEAGVNKSIFRDKAIVSPWMQMLPASEQYYSSTPRFYRAMGKMFDYSPAKLQYILQQGFTRQLDEVIRLVEAVDRGEPLQENADLPFIGRLFVRDPIGFNSQAVRAADNVEKRLQLLDTRLNANGWNWLKTADVNAIPDARLRALSAQMQVLNSLRQGLRTLDEQSELKKYFRLKGDYATERNIEAAQTLRAQAVLLHNEPLIERIDTALDLIEQIGPASPEAQAADYWRRAR
jgi:hypothetical protein